MADLLEEELANRLNLYQAFLRVYERNTTLIDDILQLENIYQPRDKELTQLYVQGMVDRSGICVITNLSTGQTQKLVQSQQIWTIGRHGSNGICIADPYLSNFHGAIQYFAEEKSFYLIDFHSTNGSHVNGEQIYHPTKLQDGDRIRLGKLSFSFFANSSADVLPDISIELLTQLRRDRIKGNENEILTDAEATLGLRRMPDKIEHRDINNNPYSLCQQRSDILDTFFSRKISQDCK
jgi:pSer/pThr/pTyr-binding forkhead associated (FHA) protein